MRAVRFDQYGSEDVLYVADVPMPEPGPGRVRVRAITAGTNPGEIAIREGAFKSDSDTFPSGQGSDFAGLVDAIGDGVADWTVGAPVLGWNYERAAQAEYVVVPADQLMAKPDGMPWDVAGALFVVAVTAWAAVDAVQPQAGETVVVSAAAGGVGTVVTQMLTARGVRVLGVAGAHSADWLRSVGAEPVERGDGVADRLRAAAGEGIDALIDTFGDGYVQLAIDLGVAPERIETIIDYETAQSVGAKTKGSTDASRLDVLAEMVDLVTAGTVEIPIAARFPLDQVADAYRRLARRGTHGKIVLEIADVPTV